MSTKDRLKAYLWKKRVSQAKSAESIGVVNIGMKSGKYLLYFFAIFHNHNKATE